MANIYTNILSSTLDAFASIIANNQNEVLKRLSVITIVLDTFPYLSPSIYGMNVPIPIRVLLTHFIFRYHYHWSFH